MRIVSKSVTVAAFVLASTGWIGGCTKGGVDLGGGMVTPPSPTITFTVGSSDPIRFTSIGDDETLTMKVSPLSAASFVHFSSSNTSVATVTPSFAVNDSSKGATVVVNSENFGTATLHISVDSSDAKVDVPITVWPNGRWNGSVQFQGACFGSDPAYLETVKIAVNDAGVGTLTATDTPGFVRQYSITIPSSPSPLTFESAGTFLYNIGTGVNVPGHLNLTLKGDTIDYGELTSWGNCANLYVGDLRRF